MIGGCRESMREPARRGAPSSGVTLEDADVTLTGEVTRSLGPHVIQLGSSPPEPVLVVLRNPNPFPLRTRVEVSGQIRTFSRPALEAELGVDLGAEVDGLDGERCLVAATVRLL